MCGGVEAPLGGDGGTVRRCASREVSLLRVVPDRDDRTTCVRVSALAQDARDVRPSHSSMAEGTRRVDR